MQHCVITGASRGIGKAIAQHFLENKWQVSNLSRHPCSLQGAHNISIDLLQKDWQFSITEQILATVRQAETICLVHNAASHDNDSIVSLDAERLRNAFEINIIAALKLNQLLLPQMQKNSSIIYMGSTLSEKAVKNTAPYTISKHAVVGMMRSTCQDLDNTGIHTCCICPGFTDTEMLQEHLGHDAKIIESIKQMVTAKRLIEPQEIANLVYFCANNPVINGSVIHANLGQVER